MNVLKTMRGMKLLKGLLWVVVISFIAAIFTLWGGGLDYEKRGRSFWGADYAVKVGGATIPPEIFRLQYRFYERQMRDMLGTSFKASYLQGASARMADDMARQLILARMAKESGLSVSDAELVAYIQRIYKLQSPAEYSQLLSRLGVSATDFQEYMRLQLIVDKLSNLLTDTTFMTDDELKRIYQEQNDRYKATYCVVPAGAFQGKVPPVSAGDVKARYEKEKASLTLPERRSVDYVRLTDAVVKDLVPITDAQLKAFYEQHKEQYTIKADERRASHVLFRVDEKTPPAQIEAARKKAQDIYERAKKGEDFAKLAKQYSEDSSKDAGGDLGWFERERMVKPFSDAVFAQCKSVGEIVGPVQSQFGFHVIKLTGLGGSVKPFEEVKGQIHQTILFQDENLKQEQKQVCERVAKELADAKDQAAFKAVADKYKLTVASLPHPVGKDEGLGPMGRDPKLVAAVFKAPLNKWESFDMSKDSGAMKVLYKVTAISPAHPATLEDVKADLEQKIKMDKQFEMARQSAVALLASSRDTATLEANAKNEKYSARASESLGAKDYVPNVGKNLVYAKACLAAKVGQAVGPFKTDTGYVVAYVTERTSADMAKFPDEKTNLRKSQGEEYARQLMDDYVQRERKTLEKSKAISINTVLVEQFEPKGTETQS
jgi:peptidyl-prolyl cis-trans isomerase D